MALVQGVRVKVVSEGHTLPCYPDPDEVLDDNDPTKTPSFYVESTANAKFKVKVTLTEHFQWLSGNAVLIRLSFDGGIAWDWTLQKKTCLHEGKSTSLCLSYFPEYDPLVKQYRRAEFSFGHLELQESSGCDMVPAKLDRLGTIHIEVKRTIIVRPPNPMKPQLLPEKRQERVSVVSEKVLKGRAVTNTVSLIAGEFMSGQALVHYYTPLTGVGGQQICVDVLYRSRYVLQMLGCIPKTPSPEPSSKLIGASEHVSPSDQYTSAIANDPDREIRELRARLALLERKKKLKSESKDLYEEPHTFARGVKREHIDHPETWKAKRSRNSIAIETVDLTDD
ncbi:hypothetical protein MMC11_003588 [Xylographa trunciseda]|nr:hypothetical protein [Xylographa trunciseda]